MGSEKKGPAKHNPTEKKYCYHLGQYIDVEVKNSVRDDTEIPCLLVVPSPICTNS